MFALGCLEDSGDVMASNRKVAFDREQHVLGAVAKILSEPDARFDPGYNRLVHEPPGRDKFVACGMKAFVVHRYK